MSIHFQSRPPYVDDPFSSQSTPPYLSWAEKEALNELLKTPFDPILDGDTHWTFRDLGQKFFNKFKTESSRSTKAAKESLEAILNSIPFNCSGHGKQLQKHVDKAWEGVGDEKWQWGRFLPSDPFI